MAIDISTPLGILQILSMTVWFMVAVFVGLFLPGRLLLRRYMTGETAGRKTVIYSGFGIVLWTLQAYVVGMLHVRWASFVYVAAAILLSLRLLKTIPKKWRPTLSKLFSVPRWVIALCIVGVIIQTMKTVPSGVVTGRGWYSFIADDALWHLGLTGELVRHVPPFEPGTVGFTLTNYHYLSNLFMADFARVFAIPFVTAQFLYIYVLISALLGLLFFVAARMGGMSVLGASLVMYLQYFASDIIYAVPLVTRHVIDFSVHPLEDGTMFLENPPRAFASVCTLVGLILLMKTVKTKRLTLGILTALTLGMVIGFKVHTGIMVLLGIAALGMYGIFTKRWILLYTSIIAAGVSLLLYLPTNAGAGGPLFSPFEMARMFAAQPNLAISFLELRRQIYAAHNSTLRVLEMNLIMLGIFYVSQFGFRTIGWFGWKAAREKLGFPVTLFVFASLVGTTAFGTLYIQPITYADIFNSYLAASVFLSLLTGLFIERYVLPRSKRIIIGIFLVVGLMTVPRIIYRTIMYISVLQHPAPIIARGELNTMEFIRTHIRRDAVLYVFNTAQIDGYASYVSAFSQRDTFLAGQNYLGRHGIDYSGLQQLSNTIATGNDSAHVRSILKQYNISILYAYKPFVMPEGLAGLNLRTVFENGTNILFTYENK